MRYRPQCSLPPCHLTLADSFSFHTLSHSYLAYFLPHFITLFISPPRYRRSYLTRYLRQGARVLSLPPSRYAGEPWSLLSVSFHPAGTQHRTPNSGALCLTSVKVCLTKSTRDFLTFCRHPALRTKLGRIMPPLSRCAWHQSVCVCMSVCVCVCVSV